MAADILIIDDEADIRDLVSGILQDEAYDTREAGNSADALREIDSRCPSLVILDIWLQGSDLDGLQLLDIFKQKHPELPVVIISGHGNIETAVSALKRGAYDYIEKPFKIDKLVLVVERALETSKLKRENLELKRKSGNDRQTIPLLGISTSINQLKQTVTKVAPTNSRIFLHGSTGTGKQEIAEYIHLLSQRSSGPFVSLNSTFYSIDRLEEALFGSVNEKTGQNVLGAFEQAHGGTLYLNEVADLPMDTQKKVLAVLTSNQFYRLKSNTPVNVDVRVVASSAINLESMIAEGEFREDLYHRLSVVPMTVPSLADRRDDLPILCEAYADQLARQLGLPTKIFTDDALLSIQSSEWLGNFNQLRNYIEQILILYAGEQTTEVNASMLPDDLYAMMPDDDAATESQEHIMSMPLREAREAFEKQYLTVQVERFGRNISKTADFIGMERSALHRKLKSLGLS